MSRQLPARPHLDHLRNQAKDLLRAARTQHPDWQLADAQFALARSYGFASWPALKAHVDALAHASQTPDSAPDPPAAHANRPDESPLTGTWVANIADSQRHPAFPFRSASLDVRVAGTRVTMTQAIVDADGKPSGGTMTIEADGEPHRPDGGGVRHQLTANWLDARTLEAVDSMDGKEVGRGRYEVSANGRRLTVTTAEQRLVFDRA